jgi:hypothetical protein
MKHKKNREIHKCRIYYSTISFYQFDGLIGANRHTLSATGTFFRPIDKGKGFSLNNSGFQGVVPTNSHATPAITTVIVYHIGDLFTFSPKHFFQFFR